MRDWQPMLGLPLWVWLFVLPLALCLICFTKPEPMRRLLRPVWATLDKIYFAAGIVAAGFMILILLLIVGQMVFRWMSLQFPGGTEFAGYAMAATSFFAFAHAFSRGAHIRVSILLNMNNFTRFWLDVFAMVVAAITATYFARFAVKANQVSALIHEKTQGLDRVPDWVLSLFRYLGNPPSKWGEIAEKTTDELVFTPIWLPQLSMSIGAILLAICIWDFLTRLLVERESAILREGVE